MIAPVVMNANVPAVDVKGTALAWTGPIRVASIPAGHPYVRHLAAPDGDDQVVRLPDPVPDVVDPLPGQWWPPAMLQSGWVGDRHREFDLAHLHFGFDAATPADLVRWTAELAARGRPLVLTVHDLTNPHFVDQTRHRRHLDVLIPAADELITLTPGAAALIERQWGRRASVIPHPHVVPLPELTPPGMTPADVRLRGRPTSGDLVIGLHAKSLRANVDPLPVLRALDEVTKGLDRTVIQLNLHPDVLHRGDARAADLREWLSSRQGQPGWRIRVHPMFSDEELRRYLRSIDVYVLPYRFGTHSGWLEACVDVGTGVLVPDVGCYADQHGHPSFGRSGDQVDVAALAGLVERLRSDPSAATPTPPDRAAQRGRIAAEHRRIYARALERVG
jgi:glycosyltransferase involved in cell wall biosynthesis